MSQLPDNVLASLSKQMAQQATEKPIAEDGDVIYFEKQMGVGFYNMMDQVEIEKKMLELQMQKPSMGDAILNGVEQARTMMKKHGESLAKDVAEMGANPTMVQALKFQYKIMAHGIYVVSASKFAEKSSKGIQTLFKPQGG